MCARSIGVKYTIICLYRTCSVPVGKCTGDRINVENGKWNYAAKLDRYEMADIKHFIEKTLSRQ